jgi:hypothetical protein
MVSMHQHTNASAEATMPRMTITLSEARQRALRQAAARRGTTIAAIIEESLEACGIKSEMQAEEIVAMARARAAMSEDAAMELALRETRGVRRERGRRPA